MGKLLSTWYRLKCFSPPFVFIGASANLCNQAKIKSLGVGKVIKAQDLAALCTSPLRVAREHST